MIILLPMRGVSGRSAGGPPPSTPATVSFLQDALDSAGRTTYTFSAQNLGTAASNRFIVAAIQTRAGGTATRTVNSVTIGGQTAAIVQATAASANRNTVALACAAVPSGTTGDVVVTMSGGMLRMAIQLYRCIGLLSTTAHDHDRNETPPSSPGTLIFDVPEGGIAIGTVMSGSGFTASWTGLDQDFASSTTINRSSASRAFASAATGHNVTAAFGLSEPVILGASWGPL